MPIRSIQLFNATRIDDDPTSASQSHEFRGVVPKRVTLQVKITKTLAPTNLTLTVSVSPNRGTTTIAYDKLITEAGVDAPVANVVYIATGDDIVSLSREDIMNYITITITGNGTTSSAFFDVTMFLVYEY